MAVLKNGASSLVLQERDRLLLTGLLESRVMTAEHIATLFFDGKGEMAKKRLQKLKAAGYVAARERLPSEPAVLFLARAGLNLLKEHGVLESYPPLGLPALEKRARVSPLTIAHELEVMDVKMAFHREAKCAESLSIAEFNTWPLLNQFDAARLHGAEVNIRPDGFIRIHEKETDGGVSEHAFFLEVDRSSESLDSLVFRATCYLDYYRSGGFAVKNGAERSAFKDYPFRVLIVLKSAERRNNLAERLLQGNPPILTQVCLATIEQVGRDPFGAVWIRPLDYREATEGTPFNTERPNSRSEYRRQVARDALVEERVMKHRILD